MQVRELSERTEAQEVSRRADTGAEGQSMHDPWGLNQLHVTDDEPRTETPPEIKDAPGLPAVVETAQEGSRGSRPTSAHSVLSRPTSAAKLQRRRRGSSGEEGYDIFRAWAQKNLPKHVKGSEIPRFTPEDLYENKIFFTDYGVKVRSKAQRKEEKPPAPEARSFSKRRAAHVNNLGLRVEGSFTSLLQGSEKRLNESHSNSVLAKEFFAYLYGSRKNKSMDIFESLRQAYKDSSKAT
eukprot:s2606_g5.t1